MLIVKNAEKRYENGRLKPVSFTLARGETLCVMGASGSGKTTLLRLIAGLEAPDGGEIVNPFSVSMAFQEDRLIEDMTATGNLLLVQKKPDRARAEALLREAGLTDAPRQRARTLSGGQKRRVAVLRALVSDGDILLLDEPFKGLDDNARDAMTRLILRERAGRAVLLVTHDAREAAAFGGRVLLIDAPDAAQPSA